MAACLLLKYYEKRKKVLNEEIKKMLSFTWANSRDFK